MNLDFMKMAFKEANDAEWPYAAVLVKNNKVIVKAKTASSKSLDPTAHAEVTAIRLACKKLKSNNLKGCTVYTTVEPCPMCFTASWWAGVDEIVYGISLKESSKLLFPEMDVSSTYLNKKSGNKIKLTKGIFRKEIIGLFKTFKRKN